MLVIHPDDYTLLRSAFATPVQRDGYFFYGVPVVVSEWVAPQLDRLRPIQDQLNIVNSQLLDYPIVRVEYGGRIEFLSKARARRDAKRFIREEVYRRRMARLA